MSSVSLDLNRLLGFKVTLRALEAMRGEAGQQTDGSGRENGAVGNCPAVLRSRIGVKGPAGLRDRRAS
jgi:hypothetical protein